MKFKLLLSLGLGALLSASSEIAWAKKQAKEIVTIEEAREHFAPLPERLIDLNDPVVARRVALGKKLYFEKALSINNSISCNSCHQLDKFGVDGQATSPGHEGKRGERNSPTVYNSALNFLQFWDGRAKDLEEQALGPILNPVEMGMPNEEEVLKRLKGQSEYVAQFKAAFPEDKEALIYVNVGKAIAAFEKTLLTPAPFDQFLSGNPMALNTKQKRGLRHFIDKGCIACHNGAGVGGGMFQKIGLVEEFKTKDHGRFVVTKMEEDKFIFKVPTLRNIVQTGPYFHDGSVKTLDEAIRLMGKHQLGLVLKKSEVKSIKDFLGSLTGMTPKI